MNINQINKAYYHSFNEEVVVKATLPMEVYAKIFGFLESGPLGSYSQASQFSNRLAVETAKQIQPSPIIDIANLLRDHFKVSYPVQSQKLSDIVKNQQMLNCINLAQVQSSVEELKHEVAQVLKDLKEEEFQKLKENPSFSGKEALEIIELGEIYQKDPQDRDYFFSQLAQKLVANRQFEEAKAIIDKIEDSVWQQSTVKSLVQNLAQNKEMQRAIEMADKIVPSSLEGKTPKPEFTLQLLLDEIIKIRALQEGVLEEFIQSNRLPEASAFAEKIRAEINEVINQAVEKRSHLDEETDLMDNQYHSSEKTLSTEEKEKLMQEIITKADEAEQLNQGISIGLNLFDQIEEQLRQLSNE